MGKHTETIALFVGDLHVGSKAGLSSKPSSRRQEWLLETWRRFQKDITKVLQGQNVILLLGGDLVDLPGDDDAEADAIALLQPIVKHARSLWGAYGTEYHVGSDGNDDKGIYRQLGAKHAHHMRFKVADKVLDWSHHGANVGRLPWTELNGLRQLAEARYWRCVQHNIPAPAVIVRHHVHVVPTGAPIHWRGIWATTVPCWKLGDAFSAKVAPGAPPTIGALVWRPERAEPPQVIRYDVPDELVSG